MKLYLAIFLLQSAALVIFSQENSAILKKVDEALRQNFQNEDPYTIKDIDMDVSRPGFIGKLNMTDFQLKGLSNFDIRDASCNTAGDEQSAHFDVDFPNLVLDGKAHMNGKRFGTIPTNQQNHYVLNLQEATIVVDIDFNDKSGHPVISKLNLEFIFRNPSIVADGDQSAYPNNVMSTKYDEITEVYIKPILKQQLEGKFKTILNNDLKNL